MYICASEREALNILKPISGSIDPETNGLIASIYKRLFIMQGDMSHLDAAIEGLEKAYGLYHGYYNGDNLAYCLNLKASVVEDKEERDELNIEARRIRKEIINRNKDIIAEEIDTEEEIWLISTLANCYFALKAIHHLINLNHVNSILFQKILLNYFFVLIQIKKFLYFYSK